jgi:hypothetical protein
VGKFAQRRDICGESAVSSGAIGCALPGYFSTMPGSPPGSSSSKQIEIKIEGEISRCENPSV